ncbi:hypothetical protein Tco_0462619 [Tanacetum coccineum]
MKRKFKKPISPSKKRTLVTIEEEEPKPAKKVIPSKKRAAKRQSAGKALKRSKRDINIHQAGGSSEGADFESEVPDEPKGKSSDTSEGSVQDDDDEVQEIDDEPQHADDERADYENQETNDDEEQTEDEFVHTPPNYVPTDDETNDESNDVTEEEYERINEELYGDVNFILTYVEPEDEDKGDKEMTNVETEDDEYKNVLQQSAGNQVKDDAQATQNTEVSLHSSSISSDYAAKYLNFDNIPLVETEVVLMLDINVQHKALRTSPLLTILVLVIPDHTVINPSETVTTASATTISSLLTSLFPHFQQSTPIPTPTTTEATTSTTAIPDSETFIALHQRIDDLDKDLKELKDVDNSTKVISTIKFEVPNPVKEYLGLNLDDVLHKVIQRNFADIIKEHSVPTKIVERLRQQYNFDQKTTLFETITKSKSFNKSPKQRALYHALMESILEDEDAMDEGVADKLKKRKPGDVDKDEGPSVGSDRGLKRQKTSKDTEPSKKAKSTETSKGTYKSQPKSTGKSTQAEETMFEAGDTQGP